MHTCCKSNLRNASGGCAAPRRRGPDKEEHQDPDSQGYESHTPHDYPKAYDRTGKSHDQNQRGSHYVGRHLRHPRHERKPFRRKPLSRKINRADIGGGETNAYEQLRRDGRFEVTDNRQKEKTACRDNGRCCKSKTGPQRIHQTPGYKLRRAIADEKDRAKEP